MNAQKKLKAEEKALRSGGRSLLQKFAAAPHIVWSVLFIIIPLIFVVYYAFTDRDFNFTLENIKAFIEGENPPCRVI